MDAGAVAELLIPSTRDFAAAHHALDPDLSPDAVLHRVFRLILHVARTATSRDRGAAHPTIEQLISLGRVCAQALADPAAPREDRDVSTPPHALTRATPSSAQDAWIAARSAREKARAIVGQALRTQMRSAALAAETAAELRAATKTQDDLRKSICSYVRAMRRLGEPAESVVTEVRVLTLECASELSARGDDPGCAWAEALHDEVVLLALDSYCEAPAA